MSDSPIQLPHYPFFPNEFIQESQVLLHHYFAAYLSQTAEPSSERFFFGYLPIAVFDDLLASAAQSSIDGSLWLMHLSGYFGGRWLRGEIVTAQPDAMLASVSLPPTEEGFFAPLERVAKLASATEPDALVTQARQSLFDEPSLIEGGEPIRGLGDTFGYNAGYMLEILASPPAGMIPPADYAVTCSRLLSCDYASSKLKATTRLRPVAEALATREGPYAALHEELEAIQSEGIERGKAVWSTGLSVQGFGAQAYDQLLDVSSSFLETVEGTALTMVKAAVEHDAPLALAGTQATKAMIVWLASYMCGLLNGEGEIEIPTIL